LSKKNRKNSQKICKNPKKIEKILERYENMLRNTNCKKNQMK
jgi:hypothetical protein